MNPFKMQGAWSPLVSVVYNVVVAPALREIYQENARVFLADEAIGPGMRMLDVGCGMGEALGIVARRHPEAEFMGVDLSQEMIERARQKQRREGLSNVSFKQGDAMALAFEKETFDMVVSRASIKHWPDQVRGLSEMRRVLKPSGRVLVVEADRDCSRQAALNFVRQWRGVVRISEGLVTEYFMRFVAGQGMSVGELESLFAQAGFEQIEVEAMTDQPAVVAGGVKGLRVELKRIADRAE